MTERRPGAIRVGSRKSQLAQIQTKYVISLLQKRYPDRPFEIHIMSTMGDRVQNVSLPKIGEKSLFTKDLEDALRNGGVDFVVHSLKDLPTALPPGMAIGAVLERGDARDVLILNEQNKNKSLATLPVGSVIGTSSLRRTAQLMRNYPHLSVCDVRGNLNTRLAKLDAPNSKFSGLILAQAGVERMGWRDRIDQVLEASELMYAVGQGALAVECRANDDYILEMLETVTSYKTECEILTERSFLKTLGGGCSAPVAVTTLLRPTTVDSNEYEITIKGGVWSLDGKDEILDEASVVLGTLHKTVEFDSDNDESPVKRLKIDENDAPKRQSPNIIDETPAVNQWLKSSEGKESDLNIAQLINIHGDLMKKCPFAMKYSGNEEGNSQSQTSASSLPCPLEFEVGQDVMGECPVLNTKEKVELGDLTLKGGKNLVDGAANGSSVISKCPYSGSTRSTSSTSVFPTLLEVSGADACPFINSIKLIDCDENRNFIENSSVEDGQVEKSISENDSIQLYCGLICHKTIEATVLEKCERLGVQLAEKLISKRALEVMKVAQNIIHSKN